MASQTGNAPPGRRMGRIAAGMTAFIIGGALVLLAFRTLVLQPFSAPSASMHPNIVEGDYFFVSKFAYHMREPRRGEIVVFDLGDSGVQYVKRLVGVPGDRIQLKGGVLFINGAPCPRAAEVVDAALTLPDGGHFFRETLPGGASHVVVEITDTGPADDTQEYTVPDGHYFMMGDNRDNSQDSRYLDPLGYIPRKDLVGPVAFRLWNTRGIAADRPVQQPGS